MKKTYQPLSLMMLLMVSVTLPGWGAEFYVDQAFGDFGNDGLSWATAKDMILYALWAASDTPGADMIYVAAGTYLDLLSPPSDTTLMGGYPPGGGTSPADVGHAGPNGDRPRRHANRRRD